MKIFSGIRPSGKLHIGNYLGAIKQWIQLQEEQECIFCVVDLHAIVTPYNPQNLQKDIAETLIAYLGAGLDPKKCIFFVQSKIKEHSELAWLLNTITPIGELNRMTQFKEKTQQHKSTNTGLLNYPVLMAADILLYKTDVVPVGKDQAQHVELSRSIAKKFNQKFGETFTIPKSKISSTGAKIMSLQDPEKKMSKSIPSSCLFLFDEPEQIKKKIMSAVTDTEKTIKYNPKKKPGISNLLIIYSLFSNKSIKDLEKKFKGKNYAEFKKSLAELLVLKLKPFREKKKELITDKSYTQKILDDGEEKARAIAQNTMVDVRKKMGLI